MEMMRLLPGDVLAKDLLHPETHHPLLPAGTVLTEAAIAKLRHLYLEDYTLAHIYKRMLDSSDLLEAPCCQEQVRAVREQLLLAIDAVKADENFDLTTLVRSLEILIIALDDQDVRGDELRTSGDYDSSHPLNVMLLTLMAGKAMGMSESQLLNLGLGALLHDIGRFRLPQHIFYKTGKLSVLEYGIVRKHPDLGVSLLKRWNLAHVQAFEAVRAHHERLDGSGYPDGLKGNEIPPTAILVAIADTYDAMLSDRPYRKRVSPSLAYQCIRTSANRHFPPELVQIFLRHINPYPLGSKVFLNTGDIAEIVQENVENPLLPLVKVLDEVIDLKSQKGTIVAGCMPRRFTRAEVPGLVACGNARGAIQNISGSGVCFEFEGELQVSSVSRLQILLGEDEIDLQGKVIWSRPSSDGKNLVGMLFTQIKPADHLKILRHVEAVVDS